ncbi:RNA 2',3'-cyclic phosphodiesterase [Amycolatopsis nigrescens]|uniref:RNA 2',3'-cyclic phosphodiesterase n=1 Tax=Amycolatopsis nigrescens TaxID=381445 RepID=UPI0003745F37|nr:RNA 2',3'-cyclic phosphodiesterase [Amycolatopsis nigrescens]
MRLFSALLPPAGAVGELRDELVRLGAGGDGLRWEPAARWHLTLGFYGEDDLGERLDWLGARLAGCAAPTVRLAGAGTFPGVLWAGVDAEGLAALAGRVAPVGMDRPYRPHLTLARASAGVPEHWPERLAGFRGGPWTATEAVLMSSERGAGGVEYTVVGRWSLGVEHGR